MDELVEKLDNIDEYKFSNDREQLLNDHPTKPRLPPLCEVPISVRPEDYFKDNKGNTDYEQEARHKAFSMMLAYIKALQITYSDKITAIKFKEFSEEEQIIWNNAVNTVCKNIVTQYSYLELIDLHSNNIQQKKDKDGNLIPDEIEINPNLLQAHTKQFPDGSYGVIPQLIAKDIAKNEEVKKYYKELDEKVKEELANVQEEEKDDEIDEVEEKDEN